jgi:VCBS repeat-containing protein
VFSTNEDTPLTVAAPGVLGNDSDLEGDDLTATLLNGPAHGTLTFNADGSFSYTPSANYNGSDSFTYKANDGALDSNVATVTLTIVAVNDAPAAADNAYTTDEDTAFTIAAPGVLGNDSDVDGDTLTSILVSGPAHGALTLNSDGSFTYTPAANYNGPDSFTYKANDGAADSNIATVLLTINPINDAPIADAGPDQTAAEGAAVSFTGLASSDVEGDPLTYSWSFSDGGSASGATPSHVFADNGNYLVTLTVSDGQLTSSDTMMVMVTNVAPTASLSGPATGVRGQARTISLGASDPSIADQAASFTYAITWGDGSTQSISGPASAQASHVFTAAGAFTVTVTATDKDGGVSQVVQQIINIKSVDLQGTTLAIGGTTAGDAITVKPANSSGSLNVTINGANQGNFMPAQLLIYGQAGNDNIQLDTVKIQGVTYRVTAPAVILGGDGSDIIDAQGSSADNILIGGAGSDTLQGGATDDIVIGGTTDFDANSDALLALLAECSRSDASEETRLNHLNGTLPGGLNGAFFLTAATVHDDGATDQLYGNGGNDWFFALTTGANADRLRDAVNGEVITHL